MHSIKALTQTIKLLFSFFAPLLEFKASFSV